MSHPHHQAGLVRAIIMFALAAIVVACAGCSDGRQQIETERGICESEGYDATSSLSHGGYVTRCSLPE